MAELRLTREQARRLAVRAQRLCEPRPASVLDAVGEAGPLQLDPTAAVARSELLVLWSRLGDYDVAELDRALWEKRTLFQWRAFIVPTDEWPVYSAAMRLFPYGDSARSRLVREWLTENAAFRRYIMRELRRRGPLAQRELEDRSVRPWRSSGWTADRNVSQMLEFLWAQGKVLVAGRRGQERVWDLAERVIDTTPALPLREAARVGIEHRVRMHGIVRPSALRHAWAFYVLPVDQAIARLERSGAIVAARVDGVRGTWYVHRDNLDSGSSRFRGRTTLLSPFDRLISNRERTEDLFGFRFRLEIYVPKNEREFGYFVLPILHGDRLVGRIDPLFDRKAGVLRINAVHWETDAPNDVSLERTVEQLAAWLGAESISWP